MEDNTSNQSSLESDLSSHRSGTRRKVVFGILFFAIVVIAMFAFAFLKQRQIDDTPATSNEEEQMEDKYSNIDRIDGKHFYIDGVHTVVGEIQMPTPCDLLDVDALVAESYPEQITLDFKVINNADSCAQVITPQRFKVTATASEEATFKALFNNRVVELNLVEAAPGETPEDFELFIKG